VEGSGGLNGRTNLSLWSTRRYHIFEQPLNNTFDLRQERSRVALPRGGVGDNRMLDGVVVSSPNQGIEHI